MLLADSSTNVQLGFFATGCCLPFLVHVHAPIGVVQSGFYGFRSSRMPITGSNRQRQREIEEWYLLIPLGEGLTDPLHHSFRIA